MRQRTPSEIKAYGDGYAEAYKEFCHLLERHDKDKAIRKMKIFVDAVALTVETATDTADTPQTDKDKVVCPNCGRSDYIRSFEKDFNIKNSEYRYKCINCNTYINDTPQTDCEKCEHWKYIAHEWQCETEKCQKTPQTDCGWK